MLPMVTYAQMGSCGNNLEWTLSGNTLIISGEGEMTDFTTINSSISDKKPSWNPYKDLIESVVIEEGVTSIGGFAFYEYPNLKSITIPEGVTKIGPKAFQNCDALTNIVFPQSLKRIESYQCGGGINTGFFYTSSAFYDCDGLTEITIPANVDFIGGSAFRNCSNLKRVNWNAVDCKLGIEGRDVVIRNQASCIFEDCPVTDVVFGPSVKHLHAKLFEKNSLQSVKTSGSIEIIDYEALNKKSVWFGEYCVGKDIVVIDNAIYHFWPQVVAPFTVEIPAGITSISEEVFKDEKYLVKLTVPESFYHMGYNALTGCDGLSEVVWNAVSCDFETTPFSNALYKITFGDKVEALGTNMLNGCSGIKTIELPQSLTRIENYAIYGCDGLKELIIPDNVSYVGHISGNNIASITIGEGVDTLYSVRGKNLSKIFWNAKKPKYIYSSFPSDQTYEISFGKNVEEIPSNLLYRSIITDVTFNDGLKTIKWNAFQYCTFNDVYFPEGLENIENTAFNSCTIKTTYIPHSTKTIDRSLVGNTTDMIIHPSDSATVPCYVGGQQFKLYVSDLKNYLSVRDWLDNYNSDRCRIFPMVEFEDESTLDFVYTGFLPDELKNIHIKCNIPGYEAIIMTDDISYLPGEYNSIPISFRGKHNFVAYIPLAYKISTTPETEIKRKMLNDLINETQYLVKSVGIPVDDTNNWQALELTADCFESNAKRKPSDSIDPFTSWDVLIDDNPDTYFHSDWNNRETTDGKDHYLQIDLSQFAMPISNFNFNYVTRKNYSNAVPKEIVVYGTANKVHWDSIATITDGLPTTGGTAYQSDNFESPYILSAIRIMVTQSSGGKDQFGHAYFALSEFGMSSAMTKYTYPLDSINGEVINLLIQEVYDATEVVKRTYILETELNEAYEQLQNAYKAANEAIQESEIQTKNIDVKPNKEIYDIMGRKLTNINHSGIYIVNGKKLIRR